MNSEQQKAMSDHGAKPSLTVYYDGACPLCRREVALYQGMAGAEKIAWLDVSNIKSEQMEEDLTREAAMKRFHVRCGSGQLKSGAAAFSELWRHLPSLTCLGRVTGIPPMRQLAELCYRLFLILRPSLTRLLRNWGA